MASKESYLDKLKKAIDTNNIASKARAAGNWFRSVVNRTRGKFSGETPSSILSKYDAAANQFIKETLIKLLVDCRR